MRILFVFLVFIPCIFAVGQDLVKKAVSSADYGFWNTIQNEVISDNGQRVAFELNPQRGDGQLIVKLLYTALSDTFPRGNRARFDPDGRYIVFHIRPPEDSIKAAKRRKVKPEDMPIDSLGVYLFDSKTFFRFPNVKSYGIPEKDAGWIAMHVSVKPKPDTLQSAKRTTQGKAPDDLWLFNPLSGDTLFFPWVTAYYYARQGSAVAFATEEKEGQKTVSAVNFFSTTTASNSTIFKREGFIRHPVTDRAGLKVGFLFSSDTVKNRRFTMYYGTPQSVDAIVDGYTPGIPVGWLPSEHYTPWFSDNGSKLYFGTAPYIQTPDDDGGQDEKAVLDIWSWNDPVLQSQQLNDLDKERKRTFLAVYHTDIRRFIQLADLNIRTIEPAAKGDGDQALGFDAQPYLREASWTGGRMRDAYLVDLKSGIKRLMTAGKSLVQLSPGGKYVVWYDPADSSYYARSTEFNSMDVVPLTHKIRIAFHNELHDTPSDPQPYGIAGWAPDDRFVYIYDRFDIWRIDPAGVRVPVSMTQAWGRRNNTVFRYVKTDPESEFIPTEPGILVSAFNEERIASGFFNVDFSTVREPVQLVLDDMWYGNPRKAKNSRLVMWTREDIATFPDLWVSDMTFQHPFRVSDANPHQHDYNWATGELVNWPSFTGETLRGILYKPSNFNPLRRYPMLVYFYERSSHTLHRHIIPSPSRSTINRLMYASNGYLVFVPDITYRTGYPGQSAYNAVVSGVHYLTNLFPFIDKKKIGLQGQSWGGYQAAWLITQTDMFAAAMAGAPVGNMISAYGGIRWESGISRMFQYEKAQSRIGGNLWERPLLYIENSPLFYVPKIATPLLIMHNDKDGAVPWSQGLELFLSMRRLEKPAWLLNYNNEPHNLKNESWENRMDLDRRMFQFFNHYLKNEPMPEWMQHGIPATEKGKKTGY